eukprot:TRINITY_DN2720_c0_g1_i3.p1 TRINITY_DN2720_c0_g1~~TRINITY_DN2720_c0_g1_i3.p1  ORF type:complete len:200 (+),score=23.39 TRINITY_DN2720_c0_g1_i3:175-774(+)
MYKKVLSVIGRSLSLEKLYRNENPAAAQTLLNSLPDEIGVEICTYLSLVDCVNASRAFYILSHWISLSGLKSKELKYKRDGDENGCFYWIGTNYGIEPYRNPACCGRVRVDATHAYPNFIGRRPFWVKNVGDDPFSWYFVDIGPNRLMVPNCYTLTYGNDGEGWEPRNWKLEGSCNGVKFRTVESEHVETMGNTEGTLI